MPIGFWAISRSDIEVMLASQWKQYTRNRLPNHRDIDKVIALLRPKLDTVLEETITEYVVETK